jgi:hypothetical protein
MDNYFADIDNSTFCVTLNHYKYACDDMCDEALLRSIISFDIDYILDIDELYLIKAIQPYEKNIRPQLLHLVRHIL